MMAHHASIVSFDELQEQIDASATNHMWSCDQYFHDYMSELHIIV